MGTRNHSGAAAVPAALLALALAPAVQATLIINEVDYDQPGTDRAEFIELLNAGPDALALQNYAVQLYNAGTGSPYRHFDLPARSLAPGGFYVLCGSPANVVNCDLPVSPAANLIQNGAPDAIAVLAGNRLLDTLTYEGLLPAPYGPDTGTTLADAGDSLLLGLSRWPDGRDTDANLQDFGLRCITPGLANAATDSDCPPPALRSAAASVVVAEPGALGLLGLGLAGLAGLRRQSSPRRARALRSAGQGDGRGACGNGEDHIGKARSAAPHEHPHQHAQAGRSAQRGPGMPPDVGAGVPGHRLRAVGRTPTGVAQVVARTPRLLAQALLQLAGGLSGVTSSRRAQR